MRAHRLHQGAARALFGFSAPGTLAADGMPSPALGLDPARPPRLTFRLPADSPAGSRCAAARFELSSKASVVWDSGKVASGETAAVVPAHIALSHMSTNLESLRLQPLAHTTCENARIEIYKK